jgi:hypothetical protein
LHQTYDQRRQLSHAWKYDASFLFYFNSFACVGPSDQAQLYHQVSIS